TVLGGLACVAPALADDTEIFVNQAAANGVRPNVLLILDTSGSMNSFVEGGKKPYDPARVYAGQCDATRLYFRRGGGTPPDCGTGQTTQSVPSSASACASATSSLASVGLWLGRIAQWDPTQLQWGMLRNGASLPLECEADAGTNGADAGSAARWARNGDDANRWTTDPAKQISWAQLDAWTLYTGNWLNWYGGPPDADPVTRLQTVQSAATTLVSAIDGVNVGLMRYSNNPAGIAISLDAAAEGGMVTQEIANVATARDSMVRTVLSYTAAGLTPLSETLYEAGQYLAGRNVDYGLTSRIDANTPFPSVAASRRADNPAVYRSPITNQCQRNFVVLLTDGLPTADNSADDKITALPGFPTLVGGQCEGTGPGRCLGDIAAYLNKADLSPLPGTQNATTYTIGFGPEVAGTTLLDRVAQRGGGQSFLASNGTQLADALQQILGNVLETSSSFTTPAVSINAFNRTETLNELYISVFRPTDRLHWPGNVKKYGLQNGRIVDANGADAIDAATGFFRSGTRSFWSATADGDRVEAGGAVSQQPAPADRHVYTFIPTVANRDLTAQVNAFSVDNATNLTAAVLALDGTGPARNDLIDYFRGRDVKDLNANGNTAEAQPFMGDPLHARPAAIAYGGSLAAPDARDIAVYVPTNDGFLHAIDAQTGRELWAFIPPELLPRLQNLYRDPGATQRTYGLDGDVRVLKFDANQDGIVDATQGDRVWIFFGMRRGGRFYYALDVTDRTRPRLLWKIGPTDLPGVGETWSMPAVARVKIGGAAQNGENLVLIFGGGYDDAQENYGYTTDQSGHRIYMVDAASGQLLWYAGGPGGAGTPDLALAKMTNSIPGRVTVLDTNGDGLADRMYAGDMGGRLWRFDITNGNPRAQLVAGGVLAALGDGGAGSAPLDSNRRFYYAPDVALIQRRGADPYYNLAVGSGYRGHPLEVATRDRFYAIRDKAPFTRLAQADYDALAPITEANLVDITDNLTGASVPTDKRGWKLELRLNGGWLGEKVLAEALTVNGVILFPTYQPVTGTAIDPCAPANGLNRVYALRVDSGVPAVDFNDDHTITAADASTRLAQTGIAGEVSFALEHSLEQTTGGGTTGTGTSSELDNLGRQAVCLAGVEVIKKCILPGGVVRTFWQRSAAN
ncbi:MAG: PilC/PilY family type IV pilus protein, partial [Steroidobacteraceae bacterium]